MVCSSKAERHISLILRNAKWLEGRQWLKGEQVSMWAMSPHGSTDHTDNSMTHFAMPAARANSRVAVVVSDREPEDHSHAEQRWQLDWAPLRRQSHLLHRGSGADAAGDALLAANFEFMKRAVCGWLLLMARLLGTAEAAAENTVERGAAWLLAQEADDGGWHLATYGTMRSGVSNTALVLDTLSRMPREWRAAHAAEISRGVNFLLANLDDTGYLTAPRRSADFPTYATALLLTALDRMDSQELLAEREQMRRYLREVQCDASGPTCGGWSQVGGEMEDAESESNFNLSVTRHAVKALDADESERCRNTEDGGF
jgi:hypothetical protein